MRSNNKRLEELERGNSSGDKFFVIKQSYENKENYRYFNEDTQEEEIMTLEEARARFDGEDTTLLILQYVDNWRSGAQGAEI
jgi:hypothetical protein